MSQTDLLKVLHCTAISDDDHDGGVSAERPARLTAVLKFVMLKCPSIQSQAECKPRLPEYVAQQIKQAQ